MADKYVFADEAGNFDFSTKPGATKYFVLTTITTDDCKVGTDLMHMRRELGWRGLHLDQPFHAAQDPQAVRDEVFKVLAGASFRIDSTVLEKRKTQPHLQSQEPFYKIAWYAHFKYVGRAIASQDDRLFVVASSIGTKKRRRAIHLAVDDVVDQFSPCGSYRVAFWPNESDPCLWAADYCTWAVQRAWERGDTLSRDLIKDKIESEYDFFRFSGTTYY
jgi:hypothetical protein